MGRARCLGIPRDNRRHIALLLWCHLVHFFKKVSSMSFAPSDGMVEQHSNSDKHEGKEWV